MPDRSGQYLSQYEGGSKNEPNALVSQPTSHLRAIHQGKPDGSSDFTSGKYHLLNLLERDGNAEVYLARHLDLDRQAALRLFEVQLTQKEQAVFLREARCIANLLHGNIAHVVDFGIEAREGLPFVVTERISSLSLRQRHRSGARLPLHVVVSYIKGAAAALHYAHERGVIHREVKPENLFITQKGELLLTGFGFSVLLPDGRSTSPYLAPEQRQGGAQPASDQYALAAVAYELLNGEAYPIPRQEEGQQAGPTHSLVSEQLVFLPPDVQLALQTALAHDPEQRFPTIATFAHKLERAVLSSEQMYKAGQTQAIKSVQTRKVAAIPSVPPVTAVPPQPLHMQAGAAEKDQVKALPTLQVASPVRVQGVPDVRAGELVHAVLDAEDTSAPREQSNKRKRERGNAGYIAVIVLLILLLITGIAFWAYTKFMYDPFATLTPTAAPRRVSSPIPDLKATVQAYTSETEVARTSVVLTPMVSATATPSSEQGKVLDANVKDFTFQCIASCDDNLQVTLNSISIDREGNHMIWHFTIKNNKSDNCTAHTGVDIQDPSGMKIEPSSGTFTQENMLAAKQELTQVDAIFPGLPTAAVNYLLHTHAYCNANAEDNRVETIHF